MIQRLLQIQYGETSLPQSWIFSGGDPSVRVPIILSVFYIETAQRKILVDAGCDNLPGFPLKNFRSPLAALQEKGIAPGDITDIFLTHAHQDHAGCVGCFPQALVHIQADEYPLIQAYLAPGQAVRTFQDSAFLDELRLLRISGHSRGSSVAELDFEGKCCVLCGDECYSPYNLLHKTPTGRSFSPENSRGFIEKYADETYICLLSHAKFEQKGCEDL